MNTSGTLEAASGVANARDSLELLVAFTPLEIDRFSWQPVAGCPGVFEKELWRLGDYVQALIRYDSGASSAGKPLLAGHEHIWVVSGAATIAGRRMIAGSYMHVPPGQRHPIEEVGPEGCTLLQMHRPHAPIEAEGIVEAEERR
jgi:hypothetical protein